MATLLASRLCGSASLRFAVLKNVSYKPVVRNFAQDSRETLTRTARRKTLREQAMAPAGETGIALYYNVRCSFY